MTDHRRLLADTPALQSLVEQYGAEQVWRTGIDVLGWPPTWQPGTSDVLQIASALQKGKET